MGQSRTNEHIGVLLSKYPTKSREYRRPSFATLAGVIIIKSFAIPFMSHLEILDHWLEYLDDPTTVGGSWTVSS